MSRRDDALRAAESTDWVTGSEVVDEPSPSTSVYSTRLPIELGARLEAEAARLGIRPATLLKRFTETMLAAAGDLDTATVSIPRLRTEFEQAIERARTGPTAGQAA